MITTPQVSVFAGLGRAVSRGCRRLGLGLVLVAVMGLGSGCASQYFYFPRAEMLRTPVDLELAYEDVTFASEDGTALHGWLIQATEQPAKGTIVHLHGNAHNISAFLPLVHWLPREGYNLFTFDYRGYGQSAGEAERDGIQADAEAALRHIANRDDIDTSRLVLLGQSLGGAKGIVAAARVHPPGLRAVIVDSTFYSYRSIVRDKLGLLPVVKYVKWPLSYLVILDRHSPHKSVGELAPVPLLILHGTRDEVIPVRHAERLYEAASEPKTYWKLEGGRHGDAFVQASLRERLLAYLDEVLNSSGDAQP